MGSTELGSCVCVEAKSKRGGASAMTDDSSIKSKVRINRNAPCDRVALALPIPLRPLLPLKAVSIQQVRRVEQRVLITPRAASLLRVVHARAVQCTARSLQPS